MRIAQENEFDAVERARALQCVVGARQHAQLEAKRLPIVDQRPRDARVVDRDDALLAAQAVDLVVHGVDQHREPHGHTRADAHFASQMKRAAHQLDELATNREAEARAAEAPRRRCLRLHERLEEARLRVRRDADAGILDAQFDRSARAARLGHLHTQRDLALHRELDGVAHQVEEHLTQPNAVAAHARRHFRRDVDAHRKPFSARGPRASLRRYRRVRASRSASIRCSSCPASIFE